MNALVSFRANAAGIFGATSAQRAEAQKRIASTLRAKLEALQRRSALNLVAASASGVGKSASATVAKSSTTSVVEQELDRDAFLQLLVMEMQNQDPLDPVDNADMIAQLAQFSSLEQMNNLNESFDGLSERMEYLVGNIDQLNFLSAQGMLGKYVEGITADGEAVTGVVDSVHLEGSIVVLGVDGEVLPMTGVLSIGTEPPEPSPAPEGAESER